MSLKHPTIIEKALMELFKETLDLMNESARAYFDITAIGTVSKERLQKLKFRSNRISAILEMM